MRSRSPLALDPRIAGGESNSSQPSRSRVKSCIQRIMPPTPDTPPRTRPRVRARSRRRRTCRFPAATRVATCLLCSSVDRVDPSAGRGVNVTRTRSEAVNVRFDDEVPSAPVIRHLRSTAADPQSPGFVSEVVDLLVLGHGATSLTPPTGELVHRRHRLVCVLSTRVDADSEIAQLVVVSPMCFAASPRSTRSAMRPFSSTNSWSLDFEADGSDSDPAAARGHVQSVATGRTAATRVASSASNTRSLLPPLQPVTTNTTIPNTGASQSRAVSSLATSRRSTPCR